MKTATTKTELAGIEAKIQKLVEKKRALEKRAGDNIAKLADQAGLLDLDVTDEEVLAGFKSLAETFRKKVAKADTKPAGKDQSPDRGPEHDAAPAELRCAS